MIFDTRVNGIPCVCKVLEYTPYIPMQVYGPGMGDAHPPESEVFEFALLDRSNKPAPWLEKYVTEAVSDRLLEEYRIMELADYYAM